MIKGLSACVLVAGLLASCGTLSTGSDGTDQLLSVSTDAQASASAAPVICDGRTGPAGTTTHTQVVVRFKASGTLQSVKVNFRDASGAIVSTTDASGSALIKGSAESEYLLALDRVGTALTVQPAVASTVTVTPSGTPTGTLTPELVLNRTRSNATVRSTQAINVYSTCTVQ